MKSLGQWNNSYPEKLATTSFLPYSMRPKEVQANFMPFADDAGEMKKQAATKRKGNLGAQEE
jgi:hypothetical protein